jgi:hypothetical protein
MDDMQVTVDLRKEYYEKLNELKVREKEAGRILLKGHNDINDAEWLINENNWLKQQLMETEEGLVTNLTMDLIVY